MAKKGTRNNNTGSADVQNTSAQNVTGKSTAPEVKKDPEPVIPDQKGLVNKQNA